jgi:SAM-dependent methyltransferase
VVTRTGLSTRICPACGGGLVPWRSIPGGEPADEREYELERCASCGSAVTDGGPPAAEAYESGQYSPDAPRMAGPVTLFQRFVARQPVRFLRRAGLSPGARVLDVGAGPGRLVAALNDAGFEASGIEPSRRSAALAQQAGQPVERRELMEHADSNLDAAVMWHVLEHLDDAPDALATVRSWLRPGGLLLIGVPNLASIQAEVAGEAWLHLDAPRHRVHFTADGLRRLLVRSGFDVVRTHHLVLEQNVHAMWFALLTRLGMRPGFPFHFLKRNIDARPRDLALTVAGLPLIPVAAVLEGSAALTRRGGTVAVVARATWLVNETTAQANRGTAKEAGERKPPR